MITNRSLIVLVLGMGLFMLAAAKVKTPLANSNPTYNQDIGPLVQKRCMQCHSDGNLEASIQFGTYSNAKAWSKIMAAQVSAKNMPPWPMASGDVMPTFSNDRSLTADEIALINLWAKNGAPQGDGGDIVFHPPPANVLSGPAVVKLTMPQPFTPAPGPGLLDQYRCFIVDPISATSDTWLTSYQMQPDQFQELHHAIVYKPASERDVQTARALETVPGQGYDCLTGAGAKVNGEILTIWAPGTGIVHYPDNTAIKVEAGRALILQIHYNARNGIKTDQSSILLEAQPSKGQLKEAHFYLSGLGAPPDVSIPLNQPDSQFSTLETMREISNQAQPVVIYGIYPHEHRLGTRLHGEYQLAGESKLRPLFDDNPWDFNWQDGYFFNQPLSFSAADSIRITCHYDTMLDKKGNDITGTHRDGPVPFGEYTTDEMCYTFIYAVVSK